MTTTISSHFPLRPFLENKWPVLYRHRDKFYTILNLLKDYITQDKAKNKWTSWFELLKTNPIRGEKEEKKNYKVFSRSYKRPNVKSELVSIIRWSQKPWFAWPHQQSHPQPEPRHYSVVADGKGNLCGVDFVLGWRILSNHWFRRKRKDTKRMDTTLISLILVVSNISRCLPYFILMWEI